METKKLVIFTTIMSLEGSIQLWKSGIQAFEMSKGRAKDYYGMSIKYHKERIEILASSVNIKGSVEEISSKEIPVIKELLDYPPYIEYLKTQDEEKLEEHEDSYGESHHPFYT